MSKIKRRHIFLLITFSMIYLSNQVSPSILWFTGFLTLTIPVGLIINGILFLLALYFNRKSKWVLLICILIGFPHIQRSISINSTDNSAEGLRVLSYNVQSFNLYDYMKNNSNLSNCNASIDWLTSQDVDVIAIQEFYENRKSKTFNISQRMHEKGFKYRHIISRRSNAKSTFGQAFYSKLPILKKEIVPFENNNHNKTGYIVVSKNGRNFRIYNVHLESMNIETEYIFETNVQDEEVKKRKKLLLRKLKNGFIERSQQVKSVLKSTSESKSPIIICGDINDLPYSYTYLAFHKKFKNAFEKKGNGFGFTLNKSSLNFLRIDNQFYSKELKIHSFSTLKDVKHSDHFPIMGSYSID